MDTSVYTHLCRAGYATTIPQLAPGGLVLIPRQVDIEIARGRDNYPSILAVSSVEWARTVVLDDDDELAAMLIKARLGGGVDEHIGECAVIAYAQRRGLVAVLDDRAAIEQADRLGVQSVGTMWIVVGSLQIALGPKRHCDGCRHRCSAGHRHATAIARRPRGLHVGL